MLMQRQFTCAACDIIDNWATSGNFDVKTLSGGRNLSNYNMSMSTVESNREKRKKIIEIDNNNNNDDDDDYDNDNNNGLNVI